MGHAGVDTSLAAWDGASRERNMLMDLVALSDFHAVAASGGFGAAGRATGTPKATLSRRVRSLEAALGVRLLERGSRSVRLTEDGRALQERTAGLLEELAEAGEEIAGRAARPRGRLRVSVPALVASQSFGAFAAAFVTAHPEVLLEIVVDDRFVDPVADGFDVVIRANPHLGSTLVGKRLSSDVLVVVASPGVPLPTAAFGAVPAIVLTAASNDAAWRMETGSGPVELRLRPVLCCSSMLLVRDAVLAGAGAAIVPQGLVEREIAAGALVRWGTVRDQSVEAWALYPSRRLQSAKVEAFVSMLLTHRAGGDHA